ncbi:MAG: hydratase [Treponema sp.]|jgi:aconitate hydratase|nr:hydratase [Treponema sp.]
MECIKKPPLTAAKRKLDACRKLTIDIYFYKTTGGILIKLIKNKARFKDGRFEEVKETDDRTPAAGRNRTIAYKILFKHIAGGNTDENVAREGGSPDLFKLRFDALASHDITFVNIVQTAKASGLEKFPMPYILTNCHNSLCAVGGTINEDDHLFGLSAAIKYGGVYVPPHLAVIHSYVRETMAGCGKMILGSDSHTRYGALGAMGIGEGGGELVKQMLGQTYDITPPEVIAVHLTGAPRVGVGPHDVALAVIGAVFKTGFVKNKVMEFVGEGVAHLPVDFRAGVDVMTTETACLSSIWETDDEVKRFLSTHGRADEYQKLAPDNGACYDGLIEVDISSIKPMIALPFHPSNVFEIDCFLNNTLDILRAIEKEAEEIIENKSVKLRLLEKLDEKGRFKIDQGIIAGCAGGTFDNIMAASAILAAMRPGFSQPPFSVYPGSQPVTLELARNGAIGRLIENGAVVKTAFCGPCFGAGDVPANNGFSIRHTTRNFPNREGAKPAGGQLAAVALMDSRSVAATIGNGGFLRSAEGIEASAAVVYHYDGTPYKARVYCGLGKANTDANLQYGPNIVDWPPIPSLGKHLLLKIVSFITDEVTTTDEIIPSGETSSFRSNPIGLAEFTFSRKDPSYVGKAKTVRDLAPWFKEAFGADDAERMASAEKLLPGFSGMAQCLARLAHSARIKGVDLNAVQFGSAVFARKPGDGSAREQAASCQRVLGGCANFANEYATKRYRSNLINWGMLPFIISGEPPFKNGDYVCIPHIAKAISSASQSGASVTAFVIDERGAPADADVRDVREFELALPELTEVEKEIIKDGCLMNYNKRALAAKE